MPGKTWLAGITALIAGLFLAVPASAAETDPENTLYLELKDGRVVYCNGERVEDVTTHPILKICRDWMAMDYVLQCDSRYQDLLTEKDDEGDRVSFALIPQRSKEDLVRLREIVKLWARVCFGKPPGAKFVAKDGLNAVTVVSQRIDKKYGTHYAENVEAYRKHLQKNDLAFAMTKPVLKIIQEQSYL